MIKPGNTKFFGGLLLVVCIEAFVYLLAFGYATQPILGGDGPQYVAVASNLLAGRGISLDGVNPTVVRTPGYPLFIAVVTTIAGDSLLALRIAQFLLLFLTGCFLYSLVLRYFSQRTALVAALITVTYVPAVYLAVAQLSETLATFLVAFSIWLLVKQRPIAAGFSFSALVLVRPEFIFLPFACLPFIYRQRKNAIQLVTVFALTLCPLIARNLLVSRAFVPLGAGSGMGMYASAEQYAGRFTYRFTVQDWKIFKDDFEKRSANAGPGIQGELNIERSYKSDASTILRSLSLWRIVSQLPKRIYFLWGTADLGPDGTHAISKGEWLILALAALIGMIITRSHWLEYWPFCSVRISRSCISSSMWKLGILCQPAHFCSCSLLSEYLRCLLWCGVSGSSKLRQSL